MAKRLRPKPLPTPPIAPEEAPSCSHPRVNTPGACPRLAVGTFDIPPSYVPEKRLVSQTHELPRPTAPLCRQHQMIVERHKGNTQYKGNSHQAQCKACQHPDIGWVEEMWINWRMGSNQVFAELEIGPRTWYRHIEYFGLDEKRTKKVARKRLLAEAVEKGMRTQTHTVKTALQAMSLLQKEEGDLPAENVNHTVVGMIGTIDLTKLSNEEIARHLESLASQLKSSKDQLRDDKPKRALPADTDAATIDDIIDLPPSTIRHRVTPQSAMRAVTGAKRIKKQVDKYS